MVGLEIAILQTTIKFLQGQCLALSLVRREIIISDELLTIQTLSNKMDSLMIRHLLHLVVCVATSFKLYTYHSDHLEEEELKLDHFEDLEAHHILPLDRSFH